MAATSYDEETLWDLIWLLFGGSAMIAGFIVGMRHDDAPLMIGTALIMTLVIPYVTRNTLTYPLRKDWPVFGLLKRNKTTATTTQLLSVVDQDDSSRMGLLEVERGRFYAGDKLRIFALYPLRGNESEGMKVFVVDDKGRETRAGTLVVRNGNFTKAQRLRIESIEVM